jgi:outer membrane protein assembly factor BamB
MLFRGTRVAALLAMALTMGCGSGFVRRPDDNRHEYSAGVARQLWRLGLHEYPQSESKPEECASGVLIGSKLIVGSRAGKLVSVDVVSGTTGWSRVLSGGMDGDVFYDEPREQLYVGTDDGLLYAIRPGAGEIRWSYKAKGGLDRAPAAGPRGLFLTTSMDRLIALDPETGGARWQYERETPEGFTIHGYAGPRLEGDRVYTGFSDGYLVALQADTGTLLWSRSLASASEQFVDVDATPIIRAGILYAASFSGGIYGLRAKDGEVLWRAAVEGTSALTLAGDRLYASAPKTGIVALSLEGNILWRQGLSDSGDITPPAEIGPYLVWSTSRDGLFIVERATGKLLQIFDPGRGMCAAPTIDPSRKSLYVLGNNGMLYALGLSY